MSIKSARLGKEHDEHKKEAWRDATRRIIQRPSLAQASSEFIGYSGINVDRRGHQSQDTVGIAQLSEIGGTVVTDTQQDYDHRIIDRTTFELTKAQFTSHGSLQKLKDKLSERGDLEVWWVNSPIWRRTIPIMCIIMLFMSFCNAGAAIYFFSIEDKSADDFEVCNTQGCRDLSNWILEGLDRSVNPCEDFYKFACNKYVNDRESIQDAPSMIDFEVAKFQFNDRGILALALRPENDPRNVIIPFYKACLDERSRNVSDVRSLVEIINSTLPYLFTDPIGYSKRDCAALVAHTIGHIGEFQYHFLEFPKVALLPPPVWITNYNTSLSTKIGFAQFKENLTETYTALWHRAETLGFGKPLLSVTAAVDLGAEMMRLLTSQVFLHTVGDISDEEFARRSDLLLETLFGYPNWTAEVIDVGGRRFTAADFQQFLVEVYGRFPAEERGPALLSFWIFCTLETYADEISREAYNEFSLGNLFPHKSGAVQENSIERFCFQSLSEHLNGITYHRFQHILESTANLKELMTEAFLQMRRAVRDIYYIEKLDRILRPYYNLILTTYMNPRNRIILNLPFAHDALSVEYFHELESYHVDFKPGPDFLLNIWNTNVLRNRGLIRTWRADRVQTGRRPQNFKLEEVVTETDNSFAYENNIYPPIVLFDRPLFLNEMRVFDFAGSVLYLARGFLELWEENIADFGALEPLLKHTPEVVLHRLRGFRNIFDEDCIAAKKTISRVQFIRSPGFKNSLAFIIAEKLYRNPSKYVSVRHRGNNSLAEGVEYLYGDDSLNFVEVLPDPVHPNNFIYRYLNKSNYIAIDPNRFKFQFKRAPAGLENFTEHQLFYLASVRHQCYTILDDKQKDFGESVNAALDQVQEFAEAWNCPIGSPMNPPNKCIV